MNAMISNSLISTSRNARSTKADPPNFPRHSPASVLAIMISYPADSRPFRVPAYSLSWYPCCARMIRTRFIYTVYDTTSLPPYFLTPFLHLLLRFPQLRECLHRSLRIHHDVTRSVALT